MAFKQFTVENLGFLSNGDPVVLTGKNGFSTVIGQIPLLVSSYSAIDNQANVQLNISYLDNLYDENFSKNVLEVNDGAFLGLKGNDYISIPVQEKIGSNASLGFIGYQPTITEYSVKILAHNLENGYLIFENQASDNKELYDYLPDAPFYVSLDQILDTDNFSAKTAFIRGSTLEKDITYNVEGLTGSYTVELGLIPNHKNYIILYIDGKEISFSYVAGSDNIVINLSGADSRVRALITYYTVPAIEVGDNISVSVDNVYSIANTSYSPSDLSYNVAMTANSIYTVTLSNNLKANVGGRTAVNISLDLIGAVNNVDTTSNTFTIDYNDNTYGDFNLANNKIYRMEVNLDFVDVDLDTNRTIKNVPTGTNIVRARNKNALGRRSPYVTKTSIIGDLPIQKVESLSISESLYKDTSQGIIIRLIISFDHIINQEVTDYEISYKLTTGGADLESFNTVKVSANGVDSDGKIRYTIHNADRGRVAAVNNIIVRVTPLNKTIRGIEAELSQPIIGKSALPFGIENLTGGQSSRNLVFIWTVPADEDGAILDIDLNEIVVRQAFGEVAVDDYSTSWITAIDIATVATPASTLITPITVYGTYTYLFKTRDTSDNQSNVTAGITLTTTRPLNVDAVAAWSEDDPSTDAIPGITNENSTEYFYPSFANSSTGGLSEPGSHIVDNSNGTSSGWSVIGGFPTDLQATGNAIYQTQVRDIGQLITGTIITSANGTVSLTTTFNDLYTEILSGATEVGTASNVLVDVDFGGIGTVLGFSNVDAATVSYDEDQGTLISGGISGNVFAIWNLGQFSGDTSNANSYAMIAGTINTNAIALGETFYANGASAGGNTLANLTTVSSSYKLVDMTQFIDLSPSLTFLGPESAIVVNTEIRYSQSDPFYANSNVNSSIFEGGSINDGWLPYATVQRNFRWYQSRLIITNYNPEQAFYNLDEYILVLDLEDRDYTVDVNIITSPQQIDYSSQGFYAIPNIDLTMLSDGAYAPVVIDKTINAANVNVYATANSTAVTGVSLNLLAKGV